jgi:hypothetical protein
MRSSFLASVDVTEFQTTEACSNLDLTNIKYSTYKQSKEENLKVMERIRPNSFMHSEDNNNNNYSSAELQKMAILGTAHIIIIIIITQFFIYLRADSTAIGLLQSQHGHIQQKQWAAQRQCTRKTCKNKWPVQASTKCVHTI